MPAARHLLAAIVLVVAWHPPEGAAPPSEWRDPVTGMALVLIPAGHFTMGSPADEPGREPQERPHGVTLTRPFYLGRFEVTEREWTAVMGSNPSHFRDDTGRLPVERVNWYDVQAFLSRLSERSGRHFRLPTEAEWEYACRAGTTTSFSTGATLSPSQANYDARFPGAGGVAGPAPDRTMPVGSYPPNAWGLYDMHGNVWEWCQDWHCEYPSGDVTDPTGECRTEYRVIRGGSWHFNADSARCALRYTHRPQDSGFSLGFRAAVDVDGRLH